MQHVFNPLMAVYQSQLEVSRRCADAIFTGAKKFDHLMMDVTHQAFVEQLNFAKAMAGISDPQSASNVFQSEFLGRQPGNTMNYQREFMQIFTDMQGEIGRSLQDCMEEFRAQTANGAVSAKPMAALTAPEQRANGSGHNPVTSMFSVWESTFKEIAALTRKNMSIAGSAAESAFDQAARQAIRVSDTADATSRAALYPFQNASHEANMTHERRASSSAGGKKK